MNVCFLISYTTTFFFFTNFNLIETFRLCKYKLKLAQSEDPGNQADGSDSNHST